VQLVDPRGARGIDVDVVVIVGLESDAFGGAPGDDGFLPEPVASALADALDPQDAGDLDRHLLYVAVTRATRRVVLGRRVADDDGRALEPSALFEEVARSVGPLDAVRRRGLADVVSSVEDAVSPRERLRSVAFLSRTDLPRAERIADADGTTRRLRRARRAWDRRTRLADPRALAAIRATTRFPVTTLERFGDCSAWWFAERLLRPRDVDGVYDARLKGSVAHVVLQRFYKQVPAVFGKERLEPGDADRAVGLIAPLVAEAMAGQALPVDVLDARIVARAVTRDLERFVHREATTPSPLVPSRFEVSFGGQSAAPGLKDGLVLGDFSVTGKIDRIDTDPRFSAHALVQDYKSGKGAHGAATMIARGRLQVPLYVLAARDLLGLEPIGGLYRALGPGGAARGVVSSEAADVLPPWLSGNDLVEHEALWALVEEARAVAVSHVRRIRAGDVRHDPAGGACPSYCSYGEVCRVPR
jgi:RecB family exonuclease